MRAGTIFEVEMDERARLLLKKCRGLLNLSGLAKAAQAGFLTRFGIVSIKDLDELKAEIDGLIGDA
jgi:hypothetical protein